MKLSKRDVNLILGILSLILLVAFIFVFYSPKHEQYKQESAALEPLRTGSKEIKVELSKLPALKENLASYEKKLEEKRLKEEAEAPEEDKEQLNENQLLVTLEEIADRTQIDMDLRKSTVVSATPVATPLNPDGTPVKPATNPDGTPVTPEVSATPTDPATGTTPADGTVPPAGTNEVIVPPAEQTVENSYSFTLKGEYRSVMIFLFELRNLEFPAHITKFELKYNEDVAKENGFPLLATFTATFGETDIQQGGVFPR